MYIIFGGGGILLVSNRVDLISTACLHNHLTQYYQGRRRNSQLFCEKNERNSQNICMCEIGPRPVLLLKGIVAAPREMTLTQSMSRRILSPVCLFPFGEGGMITEFSCSTLGTT